MNTQSTMHSDSKLTPERKSSADAAESAVPEFKEQLRHMVDSSKSRVAAWSGGLQEGIRAKPVQSLLIAAAVGAVVGMIVGRRGR